ncbi:MAG: adenylyl-sulfate kinase [Thermoplasmata archaeon]
MSFSHMNYGNQKNGVVLWFTGLPASGKTTLGKAVQSILRLNNIQVELLDGDEVRQGISFDLGFSKEDREKHAKRVVYISKLLERNGVFVIVTLISPYKETREYARKNLQNFVEIHVKAPVEVCIKRDPKGLYKKALSGEIHHFTGIDDPYEEPENPELIIETSKYSIDQCVGQILHYLKIREFIPK